MSFNLKCFVPQTQSVKTWGILLWFISINKLTLEKLITSNMSMILSVNLPRYFIIIRLSTFIYALIRLYFISGQEKRKLVFMMINWRCPTERLEFTLKVMMKTQIICSCRLDYIARWLIPPFEGDYAVAFTELRCSSDKYQATP